MKRQKMKHLLIGGIAVWKTTAVPADTIVFLPDKRPSESIQEWLKRGCMYKIQSPLKGKGA